MNSKSNIKTGKRTYKHSEAWLKAHASKMQKKFAKKPAAKTKSMTKKADAKKPAVKSLSKKPAVKKPAKKTPEMKAKLLAKKAALKVKAAHRRDCDNVLKQASRCVGSAKKHSEALKTVVKTLADILNSAIQLNDEKLLSKVLKIFAQVGFKYAGGVLEAIISGKVKLPKVNKDKKAPKEETSAKADDTDELDVEGIVDDAKAEDAAADDLDEELEDESFEHDEDDDAELDEDELEQQQRDQEIADEYERDQRETSDADILDAQEDNGDFS